MASLFERVLLLGALVAIQVTCEDHPPSAETESCEVYSERDLRLAGASPDAGRVEVFHEEKWGTLCAEPSINLSKVLCKQLGFGRAIGIFTIAPKIKGTPNWLSGIECTGEEASIFECAHQGWGKGPGCSGEAPPIAVRCEAAGLEALVESIPKSQLSLPGVDVETVLDPYTPEGKGGCGAPAPFNPFLANNTGAFVHKDKIAPFLGARLERLDEVLCRDPSKNTGQIEALLADGMQWNPFGFKFSLDAAAARGKGILTDTKAEVLREAMLSPNAKVFWSLDHEARYPEKLPAMSERSMELYHNLSRDGFVRIDDFGLDMEALDETADWALTQRELKNVTVVLDDGACVVARPKVPALQSLLTNETINSVIRAYLGPESVMHGYKILRLSKKLKGADNYIAADWHHDRAGRRLKLFVFLHDIAEIGGRPTEVANGTHNFVYWSFEDYPTSRYDDAYVQKHFDVHRLHGKRGGGFIFDTNSIHRGSPFGDHKRETIILEYHNQYKCPAIHSLGMNVPCPSGDQFMEYHKI